jgi:metal-responsive CopG/Arc/MetJ family transcriptional regulator
VHKKENTETITVSLPSELIELIDVAVKEFDISRSKFIAHAVRDKIVATFYKSSSSVRDGFYQTVLKQFQSGND